MESISEFQNLWIPQISWEKQLPQGHEHREEAELLRYTQSA